MFAYVEALHPLQEQVLQIVGENESLTDNILTPEQLVVLVAEKLTIKNHETIFKLLNSLFELGFIVNLTRSDSWGIKVKYTLDGHACHSISSENPVMLTPKGRGYLQSHDLIMNIIQRSVNLTSATESEKPTLIKKAYNELADKGLDFVAKLCAEALSRSM